MHFRKQEEKFTYKKYLHHLSFLLGDSDVGSRAEDPPDGAVPGIVLPQPVQEAQALALHRSAESDVEERE